ncbi:MAG: carboxypeptidase regulatory-like domain-containing protein [Flavobacteriaceae bacterium]
MSKLIGFVILLCLIGKGYAQEAEITVKGQVVEQSGLPVAFATVVVGNKTDQSPITGTTTLDNGTFSINVSSRNFFVEISFIGFKSRLFESPKIVEGEVDLGQVVLEEDTQQLTEVVVEGEVSRTQFKLDKRVFNVGKDISSTGVSALEVLNNVPSVNVKSSSGPSR